MMEKSFRTKSPKRNLKPLEGLGGRNEEIGGGFKLFFNMSMKRGT
jgi:hypothetical protein